MIELECAGYIDRQKIRSWILINPGSQFSVPALGSVRLSTFVVLMAPRVGSCILALFLFVTNSVISRAMSTPLAKVLNDLAAANKLPSVIVFDLDNTLWTPELYQLYKTPIANRNIELFPGALEVLQCLHELQATSSSCPLLAIASRATENDWAQSLLDQFPIAGAGTANAVRMRQLFRDDLIYIECRSKRWHFREIQSACGNVPFSEMVFFDDDMYLNLDEISGIGVLSCHTPRGLTVDLFRETMIKYSELRDNQDAEMGQILDARNLGLTTTTRKKK